MYNKTTGTLREMLYGVTEEEVANATYGEGVYTEATTVNVNDSLLKSTTESWFHNDSNIDENKLEDAVYCNDRSETDYLAVGTGGIYIFRTSLDVAQYWGGDYFTNIGLIFGKNSLKCTNITDSFNTSNLKARTNYKVGFLTKPELNLVGDIISSEVHFWLGSPLAAYHYNAVTSDYHSCEVWNGHNTYGYNIYVRPVISLNKNVKLKSGDGSYSSPFIAE